MCGVIEALGSSTREILLLRSIYNSRYSRGESAQRCADLGRTKHNMLCLASSFTLLPRVWRQRRLIRNIERPFFCCALIETRCPLHTARTPHARARGQQQGVSCYVLEMFTENLEPETVMPFLEPLMTRLVQMLQTPKRGVKVRTYIYIYIYSRWSCRTKPLSSATLLLLAGRLTRLGVFCGLAVRVCLVSLFNHVVSPVPSPLFRVVVVFHCVHIS